MEDEIVTDFARRLRSHDVQTAIELLPEMRTCFQDIDRLMYSRASPSRRLKKINELAGRSSNNLASVLNLLNGLRTNSTELLCFHADIIQWIRFLSPALKRRTKVETEKHAARLCRRCLSYRQPQVCVEVADKALAALEAVQTQADRENQPPSMKSQVDTDSAGVQVSFLKVALQCLRLCGLCEVADLESKQIILETEYFLDSLGRLTGANLDSARTHASATRQSLSRFAAQLSSQERFIDSFRVRMIAVKLIPFEDENLNASYFAENAHKALLSYKRAASDRSLATANEVARLQMDAARCFQESAKSDESYDALEEVSAWLDSIVSCLQAAEMIREASGMMKDRCSRLMKSGRKDLATLVHVQSFWWMETESRHDTAFWTRVVQLITAKLPDPGLIKAENASSALNEPHFRIYFVVRVCRAFEPLRKKLCCKKVNVELVLKEKVLGYYIAACISYISSEAPDRQEARQSDSVDETSLRTKLKKAAGAMLEAAKALVEVRLQLFKQNKTPAENVDTALLWTEKILIHTVSQKVPAEWRTWIASVMYNVGIELYTHENATLMAGEILYKASQWASEESTVIKCLSLSIKALTRSGFWERGVRYGLQSSVRNDVLNRVMFRALLEGKGWSKFVAELASVALVDLCIILRRYESGEAQASDLRRALLDEMVGRVNSGDDSLWHRQRVEEARLHLFCGDYALAKRKTMECICIGKRGGTEEDHDRTEAELLVLAEAYAYKGIIDADSRSLFLSAHILNALDTREDDLVHIAVDVATLVSSAAGVFESSLSVAKAACALRDLQQEPEDHASTSSWAVLLSSSLREIGLVGRSEHVLKTVPETEEIIQEKALLLIMAKDYKRARTLLEGGKASGRVTKKSLLHARQLVREAACDIGLKNVQNASLKLTNALKLLLALARLPNRGLVNTPISCTICGITIPITKEPSGIRWQVLDELYHCLLSLATVEERLGHVRDARYYLTSAVSLASMTESVCFALRARADMALMLANEHSFVEAEEALGVIATTADEIGDNSALVPRLTRAYIMMRSGQIHVRQNRFEDALQSYRESELLLETRSPDHASGPEWGVEEPIMTPREAKLVKDRQQCILVLEDEIPRSPLHVQIHEELQIAISRVLAVTGKPAKAMERLKAVVQVDHGGTNGSDNRRANTVITSAAYLLALADTLRQSSSSKFSREINAVWNGKSPPARGNFREYCRLLGDVEKASESGSLELQRARLLRVEAKDDVINSLLGVVGISTSLRMMPSTALNEETVDVADDLLDDFKHLAISRMQETVQRLLPESWSVVGLALSLDRRHLYLWRLEKNEASVERLPLDRLSYTQALTTFERIFSDSKKTNLSAESKILTDDEKKQWWTTRFVLDNDLSRLLKDIEEKWLRNHLHMLKARKREEPVILVLDDQVQMFPWEQLPAVAELRQLMSRVPSVPMLVRLLKMRDQKVGRNVVDGSHAFFVVNPGGDLEKTQNRFEPLFRSEFGWDGLSGKEEASGSGPEDVRKSVEKSSLFVFCGHGAAECVLPAREIGKLTKPPVSLLFGCSSGKLESHGSYESSGTALEYLIAGSPCVVGNLWDVTDRDIDRFTESMLRIWIEGASIGEALVRARSACKMAHLVGSAPVLYGLPDFYLSLETVHRRLF